MDKVSDTLRSASGPISRWQVLAGLWAKEWHEQRWRLFLGTVVLAGLLGGLLWAQIMPPQESALLIYWPTGMVLVIFLAMGSVAAERADRTWEFLLAQPVTRGDVLLAIDGEPVLQVDDVRRRMKAVASNRPPHVIFKVRRGVHIRFIEIEAPWNESG